MGPDTSPWQPCLFYNPEVSGRKPLVGCSACLLGEPVRYDGTHRQQDHFAEQLMPFLQLQAICPEVGIGLGVPRPALKLVERDTRQRVVFAEQPAEDVTDALLDYADSYTRRIGPFWPLCAYIFKARSPSCGVGSSPINPGETGEARGYGAFAGRFRRRAPWLLLYQEEDLADDQSCREMLLLAYLCRDLLWQGPEPAPTELSAHYRRQLRLQLPEQPTSREGLWSSLRESWQASRSGQRRDIVERYRAL